MRYGGGGAVGVPADAFVFDGVFEVVLVVVEACGAGSGRKRSGGLAYHMTLHDRITPYENGTHLA